MWFVLRMTEVVLFHAAGCHLCDRAREAITRVRRDVPFDLVEVDISGNPELEAKYREWLPVVEVDGERAFVYYVDERGLRRRLSRARP